MKSLRLLPIFLTLIFALSPAAAQENTDTGWPIEERCLGEPTPPPDDWTFGGTILTAGHYGIYGIRSDWETSRVLAFTHIEKTGYELRDGAFSPDMRWYAAAQGSGQCWTTCSSVAFTIENLHVFDLSGNNPRSYSTIPWELEYSAHPSGYDSPPIYWIDNENLLYHYTSIHSFDTQQLNRITGKTQTWEGVTGFTFPAWNSPNLLRALDIVYDAETHIPTPQVVNGLTGQVITTIPNPDNNLEPLGFWESVWSPDSSRFLMSRSLNENMVQLLLYDKDGNFLDTIMTMPSWNVDRVLSSFDVFWSPNSQYIALQWIPTEPEYTTPNGPPQIEYTFSLLDLQNSKITDLCENAVRTDIVWAPDSNQIASIASNNLIILDRRTLAQYQAKQANQWFVVGWRED